jgi:hypothetical protein
MLRRIADRHLPWRVYLAGVALGLVLATGVVAILLDASA